MGISEACNHEMESAQLTEYLTRELGVPVVVLNSVQRRECKLCHMVTHVIPYLDRLIAATAVGRVKVDCKLSGNEIRFLRKSLDKSAKEMAADLDVAAETYSRWENEKAPMNPTTEKLLRLMVGMRLGPLAPAVAFKPEEILSLNIKAIRDDSYELVAVMELVRFKNTAEAPVSEAYTEELRKVA